MKKLIMMTVCAIAAGAAFSQAPDVAKIKADAEAGDAMAQAQYAQILQTGDGVEKNEAEAAKWYQKAADAGNDYAQVNLGVFYQTGGCGLKRDLAKAAEWYEKAAAQGNAYAQFYLSCLYENGNGVEKDASKALDLLAKAAKGGIPDAQVKYALCLAQGVGIERNLEAAIEWAEKAAAMGDSSAPKMIATLKGLKDLDDKTPKSLLGIEFGKTVEEVAQVNKASRTKDGGSAYDYVTPKKAFRKFTGKSYNGRIQIWGAVTSHRVFRFKWESDDFSKETSEDEAVAEFKKTCEVMARKFGGEFRDVPIKESDKWTIWDRKAVAAFGNLKVEMFLSCRKMTMTVTNDVLEYQAKQEVEKLKEAEGDGSDAL